MRYISVPNLEAGMILARTIYGGSLDVLMGRGTTLTGAYINRLSILGFSGAYIQDSLSDGEQAADILSGDLRIRAIRAARTVFQSAENGSSSGQIIHRVAREIHQDVVLPAIEEIISSRHRMVDLVDSKPFDSYHYYHAANVLALSLLLGIEMRSSGLDLHELGVAALLHDIGDVFIPKEILQKPGRLTEDERAIIQENTETGFKFLRANFDLSIDACVGIFQNHENYDGTGYPNKLKGNKISLLGRILAITEAYDALVSRRPYRPAMYPPDAMAFIESNAGKMYDPELVAGFKRIIALYPTGVSVELSSKVRCLVVRNHTADPARPLLRMLGSLSKSALYINLLSDPKFADVKINRILDT
ncbi:MAG: HD-GYP domain-containing protein [Oscillospiraceae bacterium]|nr:HD-GYP domain-containing protein [Oscillospiraceae bacterium]